MKRSSSRGFIDRNFILFLVFSIAFLALSSLVVIGYTEYFDEELLHFFIGHGEGFPSYLTYLFTYSIYPQYIVFPLLLFFLYKKGLHKEIVIYLLMPPTYLIFFVIKNIIRRPRPEYYIHMREGFSYPSGHAALSFIVYMGIYVLYFVKVKGEHDISWFIVLLSATFFTGLTRLFVGMHYITDIIAGTLIGAMVVLIFASNTHHPWIKYLVGWFDELDERVLSKFLSR